MIDIVNDPPNNLSLTKVFIAEELKSRGGWQAYLYHLNGPLIRIIRPDGKILEISGSTPPTTSYAAGNLSDDKYACYLKLNEQSLPTPKTYLATTLDEALDIFYLEQWQKTVIKPLDSSHGNGVTINITTSEEVEEAWNQAVLYSPFVLIQEQSNLPFDLRFTVVDSRVVGAVIRVPARVIGNGINTVQDLIKKENNDPLRGENYTKPKNKIDVLRATSYLREKIQYVPKVDEEVQVIGTANLGTGGELIDVTDDTPDWLIELAEKVSKTCDLQVS
ncbi:MAG: hypothetical protein Q7T41_01290, partial [Candidatus Saccharibacteria bacterium]|nr:hypothetical protein [Candidatus Saccharibacteria bacterium]